MRDESKRYADDAPVETEGMGGAGGGDLDDVGDVGYPRDGRARDERDVTRGRGIPEGMGGFGEDIELAGGTAGDRLDRLAHAGGEVIRGETGVVTGITTGVDTDDATEGPGSPWENLDDGLRAGNGRESDTPT
jgi:hypothetical protein